jgi:hypothetical protein
LALHNEQEADRLARKREEIVEQPSPGAELVFNAPENSETQAWIVEVSSEGLTVVKLGTNQRRSLGLSVEPGSAAADWLAGLDAGRDHALILVRPSGVDSVDDIREGLGNAGISFGIDFIGEDQVVRDGTSEAKKETAGAEQP